MENSLSVDSVLVIFSYVIRQRMEESPLFTKIKAAGKTSTNPIKESFGNPANRRLVLIALFGATAGQGVVWYTGQFYALYFLQTVMNIQGASANQIMAVALVAGTPFFLIFGKLSDRIGRKNLMMGACLLSVLLYIPVFNAMLSTVPNIGTLGSPKISLVSAVDPVTKKDTLYKVDTFEQDGLKLVKKGPALPGAAIPTRIPGSKVTVEITPDTTMFLTLCGYVFVLVLLVTMVYGPIAAFLVELFPTRIRYTSMSLPYHIGNGVFGGLVPFIGTAAVAATKNNLSGLWYPMAIAGTTFIVGMILIHEKKTNGGFVEATDE